MQKRNGNVGVNRRKGFSLIEVLIVVSIFLLMAVFSFRQLSLQMAKGRDAHRKADLEKIKTAFEDYASDKGQYPPFSILSNCGDPSGTALEGYISNIPCDPLDNSPYIYIPFPSFSDTTGGFRVFAALERDSDPDISNLGCNATEGCDLPDSLSENPEKYNYGVSVGVPVHESSGDVHIPTLGICCALGDTSCNSTNLINGSCPGNPPYAPFPTLKNCVDNSHCTQ